MNTFKRILAFTFILLLTTSVKAQNIPNLPGYSKEFKITYCTIAGKTLTMNVFLPPKTNKPAPAMIDIHGGWWFGGEAAQGIPEAMYKRNIAVFSIEYRLAPEVGFPENLRDCRNAVRFVRKNASRFNIDPDRIGCMGGSAGALLGLLVAMVPEDFDDGGPTPGLEGISASVCNCFSNVAPTNLVRFWNECPDDVVVAPDGSKKFRDADPSIPNDGRPRLRILFHGKTPDTNENEKLYMSMSPVGHVRENVPPLLICDGEFDPIVPGLEGKELQEKLKAVGAKSTYWITPNAGHVDPGGEGFSKVLDDFLVSSLKIEESTINNNHKKEKR